MRKKISGFTLIELMIVVAIIGIIIAIAYPSYQDSIRRANRIDAQGEMMAIANNLQKFRIANFSFAKSDGSFVTLADVGATNRIPASGATLYNIALSNQTAGTWTLTATPTGVQTGNGHLVLNHRGQRCWSKTSMTPCVPSATTKWDAR